MVAGSSGCGRGNVQKIQESQQKGPCHSSVGLKTKARNPDRELIVRPVMREIRAQFPAAEFVQALADKLKNARVQGALSLWFLAPRPCLAPTYAPGGSTEQLQPNVLGEVVPRYLETMEEPLISGVKEMTLETVGGTRLSSASGLTTLRTLCREAGCSFSGVAGARARRYFLMAAAGCAKSASCPGSLSSST